MSIQYKSVSDVPTEIIIKRLLQLSVAVIEDNRSEFTMNVPVQCDWDADIILYEAANRLSKLLEIEK